jgi:hypothetical protein
MDTDRLAPDSEPSAGANVGADLTARDARGVQLPTREDPGLVRGHSIDLASAQETTSRAAELLGFKIHAFIVRISVPAGQTSFGGCGPGTPPSILWTIRDVIPDGGSGDLPV